MINDSDSIDFRPSDSQQQEELNMSIGSIDNDIKVLHDHEVYGEPFKKLDLVVPDWCFNEIQVLTNKIETLCRQLFENKPDVALFNKCSQNPTNENLEKGIQGPVQKYAHARQIMEILIHFETIIQTHYITFEKQLIYRAKQVEAHYVHNNHRKLEKKIQKINLKLEDWHRQLTTTLNHMSIAKLFYNYSTLQMVCYDKDLIQQLLGTPATVVHMCLKPLYDPTFQNQLTIANNLLEQREKLLHKCLHKQELDWLSELTPIQIQSILNTLDQYKVQESKLVEQAISIMITSMFRYFTRRVADSYNNSEKTKSFLNVLKDNIIYAEQQVLLLEAECFHIVQDSHNLMNQIRQLEYPNSQSTQNDLFQTLVRMNEITQKVLSRTEELEQILKEIPMKVHSLIPNSLENYKNISVYPKTIIQAVANVYRFYIRGLKKLYKGRLLYLGILKHFEEQLDKDYILRPKVEQQVMKLEKKFNKLKTLYQDLDEFCVYCPSGYKLLLIVNKFIEQSLLLFDHYTQIKICMGNFEPLALDQSNATMRFSNFQHTVAVVDKKSRIFDPKLIIPDHQDLEHCLVSVAHNRSMNDPIMVITKKQLNDTRGIDASRIQLKPLPSVDKSRKVSANNTNIQQYQDDSLSYQLQHLNPQMEQTKLIQK